jgi:hypothetical protein
VADPEDGVKLLAFACYSGIFSALATNALEIYALADYSSSSAAEDAIASLIVRSKYTRAGGVMANAEDTMHLFAFAGDSHVTRALAVNPMKSVACSNNTFRRFAFAMNTVSGSADPPDSKASATGAFALDRRDRRVGRLTSQVCHFVFSLQS